MVIAIHSGTVPTCPASHPIVPDFSGGFQPHLSSGTRSSIFLVFFISSSYSDSIACPIVMFASQTSSPLSGGILGEQKAKCQALFSPAHPHWCSPAILPIRLISCRGHSLACR